ncbi:MAG: hypothetical protein ACREOZ_03835, partial [Gloeomargaritales cyanobacterium]
MPQQPIKGATAQQQSIPFRIATTERSDILITELGAVTANEQVIDRVIEGTGYVYGIWLNLAIVTAANAATVAFAEDAPFNALSSIIYRDSSAEAINLDGFSLYIANIAMRNYANVALDANQNILIGDNASGEFYSATAGVGAGLGGSLLINLDVPIAINRRNLLGLLGNQDRGIRYQLRTNINSSGQIYATPPTTPGNYTLQKEYESYAVPSPVGAYGPQSWTPDGFGTIHFLTKNVSEAVPAANVTLNHYLRRIGNMWRWAALIFR